MSQKFGNQTADKWSRLRFIAIGQFIGLCLLLTLTFFADHRHGTERIKTLAETTARIHAQKDASYRELFIASGGVYVLTCQDIIPEETLVHRPDRDLVTPDGTVATLMTPKKLLRLANERQPGVNGLKVLSSIKTLQPLNQGDTPDEWEKEALEELHQGKHEVSKVVEQDGRQVLRFMYPIAATKGCVKNRPHQNLKVGDLLGGLSVTVPMDVFIPLRKAHTRNSLYLHFTLWALGVIGIVWSFQKMRQRDVKIFDAQKAQKKAYEELEKTFDAIDGIITIQDKDMRITKVNKATCDIFNAKPEDLVGKYCYEVFRGTDMACEGCPEIKSLQDGAPHHSEIEHENLNKIFTVSAVPITDQSGETTKLVHYAKDITKSRRQEQQLRQAQKMEAVGTLAGGIAHDFNNILTAIIGFSELSLLRPSIDKDTHQDLEQIHKAGLRAKELVEQILTFSRQKEQDFQPMEMQPVLKEALKLLRASIPTTINFELDITDEKPLVIADPSQIHQVIMNLCTNAYHAMRDKGGTLMVALKLMDLAEMDTKNMDGIKPGPYLRLTVGDTGVGIKKEYQERIFEPYFTTKKKGEGTGLGLSLVHGIIRTMGGNISLYSEEGQGTTFQIYLPVISRDDVAKADKTSGSRQLPTGTESVLLVDDEESIVALEGRMLESLGYTVKGFSDPVQAKDAFKSGAEQFDLVITDMNMPKLSGLDLVEIVKASRPDLPIIICTGFSERINSRTADKYGIYKVMMKPLVLHELAQTVRGALDD